MLAAAMLCSSALEAYAQNCRPRSPRPPTPLTGMGVCEFNHETFSYAGEPAQQAMCLMRASDKTRNLGPQLESIPATLAGRVGQSTGLPERSALAAHLAESGLTYDFASFLWLPLSRARDNDPEAPQARYFVIHDTSAPFLGWSPFPADIDTNEKINNLARFACKDDWAIAHVFINRSGAMLLGRELSEPWRATKFERGTPFGSDLRGLFLHIELIQPRGVASHIRGRNDARAPTPGFSAAQYERLALVYTIASVRSGRWLIPAFHTAIDAGIRGGHDDPQNFDVETFAASVDRLVEKLAPELPVASIRRDGGTVRATVAVTPAPAPVAVSATPAAIPAALRPTLPATDVAATASGVIAARAVTGNTSAEAFVRAPAGTVSNVSAAAVVGAMSAEASIPAVVVAALAKASVPAAISVASVASGVAPAPASNGSAAVQTPVPRPAPIKVTAVATEAPAPVAASTAAAGASTASKANTNTRNVNNANSNHANTNHANTWQAKSNQSWKSKNDAWKWKQQQQQNRWAKKSSGSWKSKQQRRWGRR
jgi:hypothetical protein